MSVLGAISSDLRRYPNFRLGAEADIPIRDIPVPEELHVPLDGHVPVIARGQKVTEGAEIAAHPALQKGTLHAPAAGKVLQVTGTHISIKTDGDSGPTPTAGRPDIAQHEDSLQALRKLGIDIGGLGGSEFLILNGLNPEPGISVCDQLLRDHLDTIERGFLLLQKLISPSETILAVSQETHVCLTGTRTKHIKSFYPGSLAPLLVKNIWGRENLQNVTVAGVLQLYAIGRVIKTRQPATETIMTIGRGNYRVKIGTPVRSILRHVEQPVNTGDRVILGGPFQGRAVYSLDQGVDKNTYGLFVVPKGSYPPVKDTHCLNCGECVLHCPARIMPNMIGRCVEFNLFEKTPRYGISACFECGLCGYYCPVRRPLLQYIRLAKKEFRGWNKQLTPQLDMT
ncbi:electron transporter RnfC [Thermodesulfobacteriota bacterium]